MSHGARNGTNIFLVALAVLVGLLWAGVIDAEMKWTATMFGLVLMALVAGTRGQARPS
jgi:ABC-type polysaccharide/polyol phosphate export permease